MRGQFCVSWVRMCQMLAAFRASPFGDVSSGHLARPSTPAGCPNVLNAESIWHIGERAVTTGRGGGRTVRLKWISPPRASEPVKRCEHLTGSRFLGAEPTAPGFRRPSARRRLGALLGEAGTRGPFPRTRASAQFRCRASSGKALRTRRLRSPRDLYA